MMNFKPHILFVDDEDNILQGLRRGLHSKRKVWNMSFANSGEEALEIIANNKIDVAVSDMRMPEMDGAELLEKIRLMSPETARIILSGYAEKESALKAVGPAHRYLSKPCDFQSLENNINHLIKLRESIGQEKTRKLIGYTNSVPSLPAIYTELLAELQNEFSTNKSVAAIISRDLGLTTQIMKVCNSGFFGLSRTVADLETAISLLGLATIQSMSMLHGVFSLFQGSAKVKTIIKNISLNSLINASVTRKIAQTSGQDGSTCDLAASAAILSHIGSIVFASSWPEHFDQACQLAEENKTSIDQYELDLIGTDHAKIGAYFLGLWGFPLAVCEAVAYHHDPQQAHDSNDHYALACVHLAQCITKATAKGEIDETVLENGLDRDFLNAHGLDYSPKECQEIVSQCQMNGSF